MITTKQWIEIRRAEKRGKESLALTVEQGLLECQFASLIAVHELQLMAAFKAGEARVKAEGIVRGEALEGLVLDDENGGKYTLDVKGFSEWVERMEAQRVPWNTVHLWILKDIRSRRWRRPI